MLTPDAGLRVRVVEGHARRTLGDDSRDYALRVSLANELTTSITIRRIVLRVTYRTRANFLGAVDLEPLPPSPATDADRTPLAQPVSLRPAETATGWLLFHTVNVIPRHCRVDEYALVVTPAETMRVVADASLPALLAADDGQGPATWGWD